MKIKILATLLCLILGTCFAYEPEILLNNRVLATVNGKTITAFDVMKKMEIYFTRSYPDESKSPDSRYQFYSQHWKTVLNQLIDNELLLADAEKLQLKVPDAKIRELIHERFGPNVMASLDNLQLSYDEAWKMIHDEIATQQISWFRIYKKAQDRIGPQDVKVAYVGYLKENPPQELWRYQVLSIRAKTEKLGDVYAQKAQALIHNEPLPFDTLAQKLRDEGSAEQSLQINLSDEYCVNDKDLSSSHKMVLASLTPGSYSEPVFQTSRKDRSTVHRIFYLKDHSVEAPPPFNSVYEKLMDALVQKEVENEYPTYLSKLRKQFNFDDKSLDAIPGDFQPFSLQ